MAGDPISAAPLARHAQPSVPAPRTPADGPARLDSLLPLAWFAAAESGEPALALGARRSAGTPRPEHASASEAPAPAADEPDPKGPAVACPTAGVRPEVAYEVLWINPALMTLLGRPSAELIGHELTELDDPGGDDGWPAVAAVLLRGWGGQREASVRRPDGSDVRVQVDVTPLTDARRGNDGWLVVLHQLTDAVRDQAAALREAEHRFRALAESAPIGIFLSEAGLRLGYVNDRMIELAGVPKTRLLGTEWLSVVDPEDLPGLYTAAEGVLAGTPHEVTVRLSTDGATPRWVFLRFAPTTTPARAAGFIGTAEDVTQRRAWEEKITYQAQHDPLTGLVNRRRLIEVLHELLASRRRVDRRFALLFLDLDRFKMINDSYGHDAGDRVLVEVARRMRKVARDYDLVARVSGDEFVVILRNIVDPAEAEAAARRQIEAISAPFRIGRHEELLSASVGVAVPGEYDSPESLLHAADQVMYAAKATGGGAFRLAPVAPPRRSRDASSDEEVPEALGGTPPGPPDPGDGPGTPTRGPSETPVTWWKRPEGDR